MPANVRCHEKTRQGTCCLIAPPPAATRRRPGHSRPPRNPARSATERPQPTRPRVTAEDICHQHAVPNFEGFARSSTTNQPSAPLTQRCISGLHEEMTARRRVRRCYSTRGSVGVGDGVSDRSSSHEVHAISPEQGGEHVDHIIIVLDDEQRPTGKFGKLGSLHGPAGDHSSDRRSRPLRSAINMRRPFSTAASRAPGRPSDASCSRSASTVLSMNVSTSRPIEWASSSATTNARGLTHKGHRREFAYLIPPMACRARATDFTATPGKFLDKVGTMMESSRTSSINRCLLGQPWRSSLGAPLTESRAPSWSSASRPSQCLSRQSRSTNGERASGAGLHFGH
jgi:hypothetical protein